MAVEEGKQEADFLSGRIHQKESEAEVQLVGNRHVKLAKSRQRQWLEQVAVGKARHSDAMKDRHILIEEPDRVELSQAIAELEPLYQRRRMRVDEWLGIVMADADVLRRLPIARSAEVGDELRRLHGLPRVEWRRAVLAAEAVREPGVVVDRCEDALGTVAAQERFRCFDRHAAGLCGIGIGDVALVESDAALRGVARRAT